jgi:hypothetical protein
VQIKLDHGEQNFQSFKTVFDFCIKVWKKSQEDPTIK